MRMKEPKAGTPDRMKPWSCPAPRNVLVAEQAIYRREGLAWQGAMLRASPPAQLPRRESLLNPKSYKPSPKTLNHPNPKSLNPQAAFAFHRVACSAPRSCLAGFDARTLLRRATP